MRVAIGVMLACQLAALTVTTASLCADGRGVPGQQACTCTHAPGAECPMHRHAPPASKSTCSCRSTSDSGDAALAALFGPSAVVPTQSIHPVTFASSQMRADSPLFLSSTHPAPDGPPPRA